MFKKIKKATIPTVLTIEGQGERQQLNLVYNNIGQERLNELAAKADEINDPSVIVVGLVASWECEYELSKAGIDEAESDAPGFCVAVIEGYHLARMVARAKN